MQPNTPVPNTPVLVHVDGEPGPVPGLVLKASADGTSLLVTFEREGRVSTSWLPVDAVRPAP